MIDDEHPGIVLINSTGKRVRHLNGEITPVFEYSIQAEKYIQSRLGASKAVIIHRLKPKKKCENCGEVLASDEEKWCDGCNLPEGGI